MASAKNDGLETAPAGAAPAAATPELSGASPLRRTGTQTLSGLFQSLLALRTSASAIHAFRGSAWSAAGYGVSIILRFVSRIALAKLVSDATPMGDVAIILVVLGGLEMISDLGIGFGVVQHPRARERTYLGTALSVQVLRGVAIWAIASALAPSVAWIYHDQELMGLLLFGALSSLVRSFANPGVWILTRDIELKGPTLLTIASEAVGFIVTIAWTLAAPSAWAIVGGSVAGAAAYTVGSHLLRPRAGFAWDRQVAGQIASFGGWMILSSGTYFLSSRGESLLLRGAISDVEFGCFAFATMIITTPVAAVTQLAVQVIFPMLSSAVREGPEKAARQFAQSKWIFTALALCFVWGAVFVAPPIVKLMKLNPSFAGLAWMVPLLGVRGALDIYISPTGSVLFAYGASRYSAWANVVRLVILVGGLYFTVGRWGLHGAMWVLVGAPLLSCLALAPGLNRHLPKALRVEVAAFVVFCVGSVAAFALRAAL